MGRSTDRRASVPLLSPAEQRAWLEAMVESADNAIIGKRLDGTITMWSAGAERVYGYTWQEAVGRSVYMLLPEGQDDELEPVLESLRQGRAIAPYETQRLRKDGTLVWVSLTVSPVRDANGRVIGAWAVARDITAQQRAAEQLRLAKETAERANQAKDRFLAVLSHELRTPLTPVLAAIQVLAGRDDVPDDVRAALRIIKRNVELESRLIDDLLDLTRISRGKLTLEIETVDAGAILRDAVEICSETLKSEGLAPLIAISDAEQPVRADAARLRQVLWNLLNNAAKFTPSGGTVSASCRRSGSSVQIEVRDTGVGIEGERLPRIFDAFEQGYTSAGTRSQGLGLGLAICKALVEMHGGHIDAHSEGRGKGATFVVRLPLDQTGRASSRPHRATPLTPIDERRLRIVLVEDHEDSALLMKMLLERAGHDVRTAGSVRTGVALAVDLRPDLVVSDLGLPDGTGVDLLEKLREAGVRCPAIALSGYGMEEDLARTREAGFADHLVKPVGVKRLQEAVARVASGVPPDSG